MIGKFTYHAWADADSGPVAIAVFKEGTSDLATPKDIYELLQELNRLAEEERIRAGGQL